MSLNKEYKEITRDIIENDNFITLKNDNHHGTNRYEHCKRVSYLSFLMSKMFKANAKDSAISGLLHDFFHGTTNENENITYLTHPKTSAINAQKYFNINDNEKNIIETHMYHYALVKSICPFPKEGEKIKAKEYRPNCKEGYIVCISDLLVSIYEVIAFKLRYTTYLYLFFIMNLINLR